MRKLTLIALIVIIGLTFGLMINAEEKKEEKGGGDVKLGGHMRMFLFDKAWGTSTVAGKEYKHSALNNGVYGASHNLILFISKDISENFSVEANPDFTMGSGGATPKLGKQLGENRSASTGNAGTTVKFNQWFAKYNLSAYKVQLRAGYINALFTQDYGKELFWHEQMVGTKFICNSDTSAWHDSGIEAYRSFEVGDISLPVYMYILNGAGGQSYGDNNNNKSIMVHAEPEFSGALAGLKTSVSYGFGDYGDEKWNLSTMTATVKADMKNNKYSRWALGASYALQQFNFRFEYAGSNYDKYYNFGTAKEEAKGTYGYALKVFYKVIPDKLTAMVHYDYVKAESSATVRDEYKTTVLAMQYELEPGSTLIAELDNADWSNDKKPKADELKFNRFVIGMRVTF